MFKHFGVNPGTGRSYRLRAHLHHFLVTLLVLLGYSPAAWSEELSEYQLKAAFLYNFAVFTEWPQGVGNVLNLCVLGRDPFGVEIDGINGKAVGVRKIAVNRKVNLETAKSCHIVFVPDSDIGHLPALLDTLRGLPVLTVGESAGATRQGAVLNMTMAQGRVTFSANLVAARGAHLTLSSRMLRLATEVIQ